MAEELSGQGYSVRAVVSNQTDIYKNLEQVVRKYATTRFLRPIADHTREAFESARQFVKQFYQHNVIPGLSHDVIPGLTGNLVVLDSGCGTGESTLHLARKFPNVPVIGIDKSAMRLNKAGNIHQLEVDDNGTVPRNVFWVRAELLDFWRLALEEQQAGRWHVVYHAVYYPNPWPKESEATRRFHLHPIFPTLMGLGDTVELRTNWEIYAREFKAAAEILAHTPAGVDSIALECFDPECPETAFERKYKEARQQLWRVLIKK